MIITNLRRAGLLAALAATFSIFTFAAPTAAASVSAAPAAMSGWARFGHFAPSVEPVDVWVDGAPFASNIAFKNVSGYLPLAAGPHHFELRATSQPDGPALISVDAGVPASGSVTVSAVSTRDGVASQVYDDALMSPPAGQALVRFIHAAPDVQAVDVRVVNGLPLASAVPYPAATSYVAIAAGQYDVQVVAAGTDTVLLQVGGWSIAPGAQSSIVIVRGLDGRLDVAPLSDSSAVPVAPTGGVQTGFGGMAPPALDSKVGAGAISMLAALVLSVGCSVVAARRRARVSQR